MKPQLSIIHNMGRSGGTVVSKCIGCMSSVRLLSEIHPYGPQLAAKAFNPQVGLDFSAIMQAKHWHNLVPEDFKLTAEDIFCSETRFVEIISMLAEACVKENAHLVIRDWSHIDIAGKPFCLPTGQPVLRDLLEKEFDISSFALLRHPVRIWLSSLSQSKMTNLPLEEHLTGYQTFLNIHQGQTFIKYEDVVANSGEKMPQICEQLNIGFDESWKEKWQSYTYLTGDKSAKKSANAELKESPMPELSQDIVQQLKNSTLYKTIIEQTGYSSLY